MVLGLVVLVPWRGGLLRVALLCAGAVPLFQPVVEARGAPAVVVAACLGLTLPATLVLGRARPRLWVAVGIVAIAGAVMLKQIVGATAVPGAAAVVVSLGIGGGVVALSALGVPDRPWSGASLALAGVLVLAAGVRLATRVGELPVGAAAELVASYRATRLWPSLEARAVAMVEDRGANALSDVAPVVRLGPQRTAVGEAVAREVSADAAVAMGWDPEGVLAQEVVVPTAYALDRVGLLHRAVALLRRQDPRGEVAFHANLLATEAGDRRFAARAWAVATTPSEALPAPGPMLRGVDLYTAGRLQVLVVARAPVREVVVTATGEGYRGPPRLRVVMGGQEVLEVDVPDGPSAWTVPVAVDEGAYRLTVSYDNDLDDAGGDRNVRDLSIVLR